MIPLIKYLFGITERKDTNLNDNISINAYVDRINEDIIAEKKIFSRVRERNPLKEKRFWDEVFEFASLDEIYSGGKPLISE